jgi:hypothetical protein
VKLLREEGDDGEMQLSPLFCMTPPTFSFTVDAADTALPTTSIYTKVTAVIVAVHNSYTTLPRTYLLPCATNTITNQ